MSSSSYRTIMHCNAKGDPAGFHAESSPWTPELRSQLTHSVAPSFSPFARSLAFPSSALLFLLPSCFSRRVSAPRYFFQLSIAVATSISGSHGFARTPSFWQHFNIERQTTSRSNRCLLAKPAPRCAKARPPTYSYLSRRWQRWEQGLCYAAMASTHTFVAEDHGRQEG